jgi:hypothetical protein
VHLPSPQPEMKNKGNNRADHRNIGTSEGAELVVLPLAYWRRLAWPVMLVLGK